MEQMYDLTPWDAVERTPEGYVLCPNCGAVMLDETAEEDPDTIDVFWCPRCDEWIFLDTMTWEPEDGTAEGLSEG